MNEKNKEFFKKYQIGCWFYRTTSYELKYDPIQAQKDLGFTYIAMPEHWHYGKTGLEERKLDEYMQTARKLNMPVLYSDRRFFGTRSWAKPSIEKARERLHFAMENYGDIINGIYIADEPWWGHMDEHKAIDACKEYVDMVRKERPDLYTFIALLGVDDRYKKGAAELNGYIDTVHPDFLLFNVYSEMMAEPFESNQGMVNFYYQLYVYVTAAKERNLPLWASLMVTSCWSFRQPTKEDLRWQLNVCAAHGVKGFVWYHMQEHESSPGITGTCPIDSFDNRTQMFNDLQYEDKAFMRNIASRLEDYTLKEVYHYMFRQSNFKAFEFEDDEYIEDVRSLYNRHLIISRFEANDGSKRQRIMITNGSATENGNFKISFKGEYAKYNVSNEAGFLGRASAKIIDLFDQPEDPRDVVLD